MWDKYYFEYKKAVACLVHGIKGCTVTQVHDSCTFRILVPVDHVKNLYMWLIECSVSTNGRTKHAECVKTQNTI